MAKDNGNFRMQYLRQSWSAVHQNQTMALEDYLDSSMNSMGVPAMNLHSEYSRFVLGLIDNSTPQRKILKLCIKAEEIPYLKEQYNLAVLDKRNYLNSGAAKASETEASPAYTVQIRTGALKGRTPADILINDPDRITEMERTKTWLAEHLDRYPDNQKIIDAIDDANYLQSIGELTPEKMDENKASCVVYDKKFKIMSCNSSEKKLQCAGRITCDFTRNNSWCFTIDNWDIPMVNGAPDKDHPKNKRTGVMYLNDEEMASFIDVIYNGRLLFENHVYAAAYNFVQENKWTPESKEES